MNTCVSSPHPLRHEIAEIAGVISVSCYNGQSTEKHVVLFRRDSCPGEEELKKRRLGEVSTFTISGIIFTMTFRIPLPRETKMLLKSMITSHMS